MLPVMLTQVVEVYLIAELTPTAQEIVQRPAQQLAVDSHDHCAGTVPVP
jgi:hypothetical protein